MHSLTSAKKMPTNKESIYFSRTSHFLHHDLNALNNLTQHQPTNHFFLGTPSNTIVEPCRTRSVQKIATVVQSQMY